MDKFTEYSATKIYKVVFSTNENNLLLNYTIYRQLSQLVPNTKPNFRTDDIDTK